VTVAWERTGLYLSCDIWEDKNLGDGENVKGFEKSIEATFEWCFGLETEREARARGLNTGDERETMASRPPCTRVVAK